MGRIVVTDGISRIGRPKRLPDVKLAFEQVVIRHGPAVLRLCRSTLPAADAEDAWSDTFLAALGAYPSLPPDANVQAWLITIARRKVIDLDSNTRPRAGSRGCSCPNTLPGSGCRTASPTADELWTAVRGLPDKQRQALTYHHLVGLPYAEVADILGGTADSARRAAADGVRNLRRTLTSSSTERSTR